MATQKKTSSLIYAILTTQEIKLSWFSFKFNFNSSISSYLMKNNEKTNEMSLLIDKNDEKGKNKKFWKQNWLFFLV